MTPSVRALSTELQEIAKRELNEDPARRDQDIAHIKKWLKKQPHIKARTDDQWILTFLRGCKFSLERTKEKLDTYYTVRTLLPEMFANRDPMSPELQEMLKMGFYLPMRNVDDKGRRGILIRICNPGLNNLYNSMKINFMIMDILMLEDDNIIVNGSNALMDVANMTMGHLAHLTPAVVKKVTMCFQEAYPVRPQSVNFLNFPSYFQTMFNIFQTFMKEKLRTRVHVHADIKGVLNEVPKKALPKEYGGEYDSLPELTVYWKEKVESYRDWFLEDQNNKTDEKKRVGRPKTQETMFGLEGSFRQLNVD